VRAVVLGVFGAALLLGCGLGCGHLLLAEGAPGIAAHWRDAPPRRGDGGPIDLPIDPPTEEP
jgi:hypothetical protein